MGRDDWYRNSDWSPEIEAAFYQRLRRARDKVQYLSIQAGYLTRKHPDIALRLIDEYLSLGANFNVVLAHTIRAEAYRALGDIDAALSAYEAAIAREREFPSSRTNAYLDFAQLVIDASRTELYARTSALLEERKTWAAFPAQRYRAHGAQAIFLLALGESNGARGQAKLALEAAAEEHSGFRYHAKLGLVEGIDDSFGTRVQAIAHSN